MITRILAKYGNHYIRTGPRTEIPVNSGYATASRFTPSHVSESFAFDIRTMRVADKPHKKKLPDSVSVGSKRFWFEKGKINYVRVIPEDLVAELDAIDAELIALEKRRRDLLDDSYLRGKPLTKQQALDWFSVPPKAPPTPNP